MPLNVVTKGETDEDIEENIAAAKMKIDEIIQDLS
jgi:hypothetical protein